VHDRSQVTGRDLDQRCPARAHGVEVGAEADREEPQRRHIAGLNLERLDERAKLHVTYFRRLERETTNPNLRLL